MKYYLFNLICLPFYLMANEMQYDDSDRDEWYMWDYECVLTDKQRGQVFQKIQLYRTQGYKALYEAEKQAWYIPNMNIRQVTHEAIKGAICTVGKAGCKGCVIAACLAICAEAGAKIYEQYLDAQTYLFESKHCFEMADWLQEILNKDGCCK